MRPSQSVQQGRPVIREERHCSQQAGHEASQHPVQRLWQPRGCTEHCINAVGLRCGLKTKMCLQRRTLHSFGQNHDGGEGLTNLT